MLPINTCNKYLVRANLALGARCLPSLYKLPTCIGPFKLAYSPNAAFFWHELGEAEPEWVKDKKPDSAFPISPLYIDCKIQVAEEDNPSKHADGELESLEGLIRLFQPGEVSVRRHDVWRIEEDYLRTTLIWDAYDFKPLKPLSDGLHERSEYPLGDDKLDDLIKFVDKYWDLLEKTPTFLHAAMVRFNSSYEKRDPADRLIDLIIVLEAIFADSDRDSITYKVAMRCACWLHKPGKERKKTFASVKRLYSARSKVIHGTNPSSTLALDELECIVRESLKRCLDYQAQGSQVPHGKELDGLIMTGQL